jgi:hypothetical protein
MKIVSSSDGPDRAQFWQQPWRDWRAAWKERVGFLDPTFHLALAVLVMLSPHHILQSLFVRRRYEATDAYLVLWGAFGCALAAHYAPLKVPENLPGFLRWLIVLRLAELIVRELWIVLYRRQSVVRKARPIVIAIANYAVAALLFGALRSAEPHGFSRAAWIALSFTPLSEAFENQGLDLAQAAYCLVFITSVLATFIAGIGEREKGSTDGGPPRFSNG